MNTVVSGDKARLKTDMSEPYERSNRLNLGCGEDIRSGYVNHDLTRHSPGVDVTHDLRVLPWPWEDDTAEEIRFIDVLEHLPEVVPIIDECWRILRAGGVLYLSVPHYEHQNAWLDPTHLRAFHLDSFDYFDPATYWGEKYWYYTERKWKVEHKDVRDGNVVVDMRARKDPEATIEYWARLNPRYARAEMLRRASADLAGLIGSDDEFILVDDGSFEGGIGYGRRAIPFMEQDGHYWGSPPDDGTAIQELDRLRQAGARLIVFTWPSFWWLEYYSDLHTHLRSAFPCVLENGRLIVFDIADPSPR